METKEVQAIHEQLARTTKKVLDFKAELEERRKRQEAGAAEYASVPSGYYWGDRGLAPAFHAALTAAVGAIANPFLMAKGIRACDSFRASIMKARRDGYVAEAPGYETEEPLAWAKLLDEHLLGLASVAVDKETAELRGELEDATANVTGSLEAYLLAVDEKAEEPFRDSLSHLVKLYIDAKHAIPAWVANFAPLRGYIADADAQMKKLTAAVRNVNKHYLESSTADTADAVRRLGELLSIPNEA